MLYKLIIINLLLINSLWAQIQIYKEGSLFGVKDIKGKDVILPLFEGIKDCGEGTYAVKANGKWGLLDYTGKYLLNCIYASVGHFKNGYSIINFDGKYGIIDKFGNKITKAIYEEVYDFNQGFSRVKLSGKWGIVTTQGKYKLKPRFDFISKKIGSISLIKLDNKYGLLDKDFKELARIEYTEYKWLSRQYIALKKKSISKIYNISDKSYKIVESSSLLPYSQKAFRAKSGDFWGLIDFNGKWVLQPNYSEISDLENKMGRIKDDGLFGFIDHNGKIVFPPTFSSATKFSNGLAKIQDGKTWKWIDTQGKVILSDTDIEAESEIKAKATSSVEQNPPNNIEINTLDTLEKIQSKNQKIIKANETMYYNSYPGYFYRPYYRQRYLNRCRPIIQYNGSRWNISLGGCGIRFDYNNPPHFRIRL